MELKFKIWPLYFTPEHEQIAVEQVVAYLQTDQNYQLTSFRFFNTVKFWFPKIYYIFICHFLQYHDHIILVDEKLAQAETGLADDPLRNRETFLRCPQVMYYKYIIISQDLDLNCYYGNC